MAAIGGVAIILLGLRAWLRRGTESLAWVLVTAGILAGLVWTPAEWRTAAFVVVATLIGLFAAKGAGRLWAAAALAAIFWLIETRVPGGTSAIILAILAIVGYFRTRVAVRHLTRLIRAAELVPGTKPTREVEVTGTVLGPDRVIPGTDLSAAAWKLGPLYTEYVVIQTDVGPAFAELSTASLDGEAIYLDLEARNKIFEAEEKRSEPRMKERPTDATIQVFRAGGPAYVVGIPAWEMPPSGSAGYRDAEVVPVFRRRAKETPPVFVANRSETEIRRESWWTLASWAGWGVVCGCVAVLMTGWGL